MNSTHLEYFRRVAESGSISKTAVTLGINQSALSRHIRNLEADLGVSLFHRNGRGVVLTASGHRLLVRAANVMEEIALAKQEAAAARRLGMRELVVGITPTVARVLVLPLARKLADLHPGIKLRFVEGFSGTLVEWVDMGELDVAILYGGRHAHRLRPETLVNEKLCLVASARRERLPTKTRTSVLADYKLILPSPRHGLRRLVDGVAARNGLHLDVTIEADAFSSILALVHADLGCTILPAAAIQDELSREELQASLLIDPEVARTLILVTSSNRPVAEGIKGVVRLIRRLLRPTEAGGLGE